MTEKLYYTDAYMQEFEAEIEGSKSGWAGGGS